MLFLRFIQVREHERGLLFRDDVFERLLTPGRHWIFGAVWKVRVERVSVRDAIFDHRDLEVIVRSGALAGEAEVLDLADSERALVWLDGRFATVFGPGLHALWKVFHKVRTEVVDAGEVRFEHRELAIIFGAAESRSWLERINVDAGQVALLMVDGRHRATLDAGTYALWRNVARRQVLFVDRREQVLDIAGQDVMTADKVTLRLNAVVSFRVADPLKSVTAVENAGQALYREAQLALRAVIGTRELDVLLSDKDAVAGELDELLRERVAGFGLEVVSLGLRDLILPGEMRTLMNRVTEARKAAEANLIARREETAAMRSAGQHRQDPRGQPDADEAAGARGAGEGGRQGPAQRDADRDRSQ